jgi:hypothetical protein
MNYDTKQKKGPFTAIRQFAIYAENKVGRLNEVINVLSANQVHIMALSSVDGTDSTIIRIVVDYFEQAIALLEENNFAFNTVEVIAVEIDTEESLKRVTGCLVEAEINIHYIYPFLMRPHGKSGLVLRLEDNELAIEVLRRHQVNVLSQEDIAR